MGVATKIMSMQKTNNIDDYFSYKQFTRLMKVSPEKAEEYRSKFDKSIDKTEVAEVVVMTGISELDEKGKYVDALRAAGQFGSTRRSLATLKKKVAELN